MSIVKQSWQNELTQNQIMRPYLLNHTIPEIAPAMYSSCNKVAFIWFSGTDYKTLNT